MEMTIGEKSSKICCVTGGGGYIGSWLVKKIMEKGHLVHATLRNLGDSRKVELLRNLPGADTKLRLFQADVYGDAGEFEAAIDGCDFVFHVATPLVHNPSSKYKNTTEAAIAATDNILSSCVASGTVKRLIYTASVVSTSPLHEDGSGFKDSLDESCWTPLGISYAHSEENEKDYTSSKTLVEKELLKHNEAEDNGGVEVVSLACGLVGGDTLLSYFPVSAQIIISPLIGDKISYKQLQFLQQLIGSVPLMHIDDICEAHIFCMEQPLMAGRFLCAAAYPTLSEIADVCRKKYGDRLMVEIEDIEKKVVCASTKLVDMGFKCKYDVEKIIEDSVESAKRLGAF